MSTLSESSRISVKEVARQLWQQYEKNRDATPNPFKPTDLPRIDNERMLT